MSRSTIGVADERKEAIERLQAMLPPGGKVSAEITHVSRSGMSRDVRCLIARNGEVQDITWLVARAIGEKPREGVIRIGGCGFDARFEVVYQLGYALYREGFPCAGEGCPSNDHANRVQPPENACTGESCTNLDCAPWIHREGGYALNCSRL